MYRINSSPAVVKQKISFFLTKKENWCQAVQLSLLQQKKEQEVVRHGLPVSDNNFVGACLSESHTESFAKFLI